MTRLLFTILFVLLIVVPLIGQEAADESTGLPRATALTDEVIGLRIDLLAQRQNSIQLGQDLLDRDMADLAKQRNELQVAIVTLVREVSETFDCTYDINLRACAPEETPVADVEDDQ
jgi:hypothetical protein|tara:strand:- start:576 stop:926 length:351 start_codon:yes stop_codon:yes gene_type:complete